MAVAEAALEADGTPDGVAAVATADGVGFEPPQPASRVAERAAASAAPSSAAGLALERRIIDYPDRLQHRVLPNGRGRCRGSEHGVRPPLVSNPTSSAAGRDFVESNELLKS